MRPSHATVHSPHTRDGARLLSGLAPQRESATVVAMLIFIGKLGLAALSGVIILALL